MVDVMETADATVATAKVMVAVKEDATKREAATVSITKHRNRQ